MNRLLVLVLIICIISLLINHSIKICDSASFIQVHMEELTDDLLDNRYPIVLLDKVVKKTDIPNTIFKWIYYTTDAFSVATSRLPVKVCATYNIIYAEEDSVIMLRHPLKPQNDVKDVHDVHVSLQAHQSIIVPIRWYYNRISGKLAVMSVYGPYSIFSTLYVC